MTIEKPRARQTTNGKAFEYACVSSLFIVLSGQQKVIIEDTPSLAIARSFYNALPDQERTKMDRGAFAAVRVILRLEPYLVFPNSNEPLYLSIQQDAAGITGDVRDILAIRQQNGWQIGISCKHNHSAVKHSRLSATIDFGDKWFGIPCSQGYFDEITPIFDELEALKQRGVAWSQIPNKERSVYIPILEAFMRELELLNSGNPLQVPRGLISYLLGLNDFYKVISMDKRQVTQIQVFNLYGTLNQPSGRNKPLVRVPPLNLPTQFYNIDFKQGSGNTVEIVCDYGWTVSLRIHNARTLAEPSLKFDCKLIGVPPELFSQHEPWQLD